MELRALLPSCLALLAAACSTQKTDREASAAQLYSMPFQDAPPAPRDDDFATGDTEAFQLEFVLERANGSRLMAPRITCAQGRVSSIGIGQESGDGGAGRVRDGLEMQLCATRVADGGVCLDYRIHLAKVRADEGTVERADAEGARWIEPGVQALLARLPSPEGDGPLLVLAKVTAVRVELPPEEIQAAENQSLGRAMTGNTRHLRVSAAVVERKLAPGTVLDETAMPDVLKPAGGRVLCDLESYTCVDSRVFLGSTQDAAGQRRGIVVRGRDDGRLELSWTTSGQPRTATVRPSAGRRFVALANVEDGATAGVIVSVDVD